LSHSATVEIRRIKNTSVSIDFPLFAYRTQSTAWNMKVQNSPSCKIIVDYRLSVR